MSDLFKVYDSFEELKLKFSAEYKTFELWRIPVEMLSKHVKEYLTLKWNINDDDYDIIRFF
jgi:hypothetical protein